MLLRMLRHYRAIRDAAIRFIHEPLPPCAMRCRQRCHAHDSAALRHASAAHYDFPTPATACHIRATPRRLRRAIRDDAVYFAIPFRHVSLPYYAFRFSLS